MKDDSSMFLTVSLVIIPFIHFWKVDLYQQGRAEKPPIRVFNTVINACEICGEEELTVRVLEQMEQVHESEGNVITFNIALKRLAKQGNTMACEGIIIGMLQNNIEPSVVTYTTAIAACVNDGNNSALAAEWLKRMRSRKVQPNAITYNTAFASCLDGTLEGTMRGSRIASEMLADIDEQLNRGTINADEYTDITPNFYTKSLARDLMKQLKTNWEAGDIDKQVAKATLRVPLYQLVEFSKSETATKVQQQQDMVLDTASRSTVNESGGDEAEAELASKEKEEELEYTTVVRTHRAAAV